MCMSSENLRRSEARDDRMQAEPLLERAGLDWSQPSCRAINLLHASQPLPIRAFSWARFHLTRHVEICRWGTSHSPSMFKAVEESRTQQLSLKGITERLGPTHRGNDAELRYSVDAQPTESATAPEGMIGQRPPIPFSRVGGLYSLNNHPPKGITEVLTCYVYIMEAGEFVKIGVAKCPDKRLEQMQTGNPFAIKILALLPFSSPRQAYAEESRIHKFLRSHHFRGEWFHKRCLKDAFRYEVAHEMTAKQQKKIKKPANPAKWQREYQEERELVYAARQHLG